MSAERTNGHDRRMERALLELQRLIRGHFPTATFAVSRGEDPEGVYLTTTVAVEDMDTVVDVIIDRLLAMQIDESLPIYVIPVRPLAQEMIV